MQFPNLTPEHLILFRLNIPGILNTHKEHLNNEKHISKEKEREVRSSKRRVHRTRMSRKKTGSFANRKRLINE